MKLLCGTWLMRRRRRRRRSAVIDMSRANTAGNSQTNDMLYVVCGVSGPCWHIARAVIFILEINLGIIYADVCFCIGGAMFTAFLNNIAQMLAIARTASHLSTCRFGGSHV